MRRRSLRRVANLCVHNSPILESKSVDNLQGHATLQREACALQRASRKVQRMSAGRCYSCLTQRQAVDVNAKPLQSQALDSVHMDKSESPENE